ncbi:Glucokinase [Dyadobacter sp. CECT 9275]|uniref:Glucokinase n=1 Tax=Dyadobacter helix TaxID=2822344 RepID=A0A916J6Y8_9BACT|nr:ROK family protein [Dyadobacter sp. CECT 9275]CAG4988965.1 Glucokinase [Dyadobacter sp. CECT 9275]
MNIGVDIGGTNIRAGIELGGTITKQHKMLLENKDSLAATLSQLKDLIRPLTQYPIKGIGIGVPSVVDVSKGIVYNVMNIPSWEEVALRDIIENEFNIPVSINNDVNCFILGEHRFGLAKKYKSVVGMAIGTGLGSGIIINDQLYAGNNCGAGEIGMLPYRDSVLENYVCNRFFEDTLGMDANAAHQLANAGDSRMLAVWEEFGKHLAAVIKTVMYTYDPEAIVLGGSIAKAHQLFKKGMLENLKDFAYPESVKRLTLLLSEDDNIALLGAAALMHDIQ